MEKGILAQLLEALEKTRPLSRHPILAEMVARSREPIEGQWKYPFHLVRYAAIDIIKPESGIFVGDRLKGKKIPSIPPKFQTWPIKDPEELVFLLAIPLVRDIENDICRAMRNFAKTVINRCSFVIEGSLNRLSELPETWGIDVREGNLKDSDFYQTEVKLYFSMIVMSMNPLPGVIKTWINHKIKKKINKIKADMDGLKKELLVSVPEDFFRMEDIIDYWANVLQRNVPEAPEETIARRVVDLFNIANIEDVRYQTVLQRIYRRKQKTT